jgi:outer membrane usher protein
MVRRCRALIVMLMVASGAAVLPARAQSLRPEAAAPAVPTLLYLEMVINGVATGSILRVEERDGSYLVAAGQLRALSIRAEGSPDELVAVDRLDGVDVEYDSHRQRLLVNVPVNWLPAQTIAYGTRRQRIPAGSSRGLLFNYDVHVSEARRSGQYTAWAEQRWFDRWGTVTNTGIMRGRIGREQADPAFVRFDTTFTYNDEDRMLSYQVGDVLTGSLPWTRSVRIGGASIQRRFSIRPDLITYPLPQFRGQATVPSAVDLLIDGRRSVSADVPPGPFVIDDIPQMTGAGTATIVTTDAAGRQVATDVSFYVANTLLRKGLADYSISAGAMRRAFGLRSFEYGRPVGSGFFRYGLTNTITVTTHADGGPGLVSGGLGADVRLWLAGVASVSYSASHHERRQGEQYSIAYSYRQRLFAVTLRRIERTSPFADLTVLDQPAVDGGSLRMRRLDQATISVLLGRRGGALNAGYFDSTDQDTSLRRRVASLSYHRTFIGRSSINIAYHHRLADGRDEDRTAQVQLILPLGRAGTASARVTRENDDDPRGAVYYNRTAPIGGGIGWSVGVEDASDAGHAQLTWRTRHVDLQAGVRRNDGRTSGSWASASGAVVFMGGGVFTASRVSDAFVIVDTNGHANIPVRYEHQFVGRTNRNGKMIVPFAPAYYGATYEIDPLGLDPDVRTPVTEQRVAVRRNAGLVVRFPVERVASALVELVDESGEPLPLGSSVVVSGTDDVLVVGWGGVVYLENARPSNLLTVTRPRGGTCQAIVEHTGARGIVPKIGPVVCR